MTQAITSGRPAYELRSKQRGPSDLELEVWQVPSTATPELKEPRRVAGLGGHKLLLVEGAVLRRLKAEQVSLGKLNNARESLAIARECRNILGGNGITLEYPIIRHMNNLESVYTYEGTNEMHTLVIGEALTGIAAYR